MKQQSKWPLVSIVIPVYNGSDYLREAVNSALRQDYPNIEVLVVDDGSSDGGKTRAIAESFGSRIRYLHKENGGVATALNMGIRQMKGEYFSWLSHDDLYARNKVSSQMKLLRAQDDPTALVFSGYWLLQGKRIIAGRDFRKGYAEDALRLPLFPVFHCMLNGCTMLIHRSHFERAGLFDESLPTTQDYDLWFRMCRGQRALYCPTLAVYSRIHEQQTSLKFVDTHEQACTELWTRLLNALTDAERSAMAQGEADFWQQTGAFFDCATSYAAVVAYCKAQGGAPSDALKRLEADKWQACMAGEWPRRREQLRYSLTAKSLQR